MGYSGYQPHGQWGNRVQGVWAIGYRGMGYMIHGQWVQEVWASWGNRVQGVWGTGV